MLALLVLCCSDWATAEYLRSSQPYTFFLKLFLWLIRKSSFDAWITNKLSVVEGAHRTILWVWAVFLITVRPFCSNVWSGVLSGLCLGFHWFLSTCVVIDYWLLLSLFDLGFTLVWTLKWNGWIVSVVCYNWSIVFCSGIVDLLQL